MSDELVFRGERRVLDSTPLEPYLRALPGKPDFRLRPEIGRDGYVAHWQVRDDDTLWLTRLETRPIDHGPDPGLRLLFPHSTGPVPASWVSQRLRSPDEGDRRYSYSGSVTARELHLWFEVGRLLMIEEHRAGRPAGYEFTGHLEGHFGPDEAAFLRAIRAAPLDDSAPRLVYADWLEERHDVRGNVIRLIERLRPMAPDLAARERAAHADLLRSGLRQGLWAWILGYDAWAAATQPIVTHW